MVFGSGSLPGGVLSDFLFVPAVHNKLGAHYRQVDFRRIYSRCKWVPDVVHCMPERIAVCNTTCADDCVDAARVVDIADLCKVSRELNEFVLAPRS
eukprot:5190947-Pyramimonas_sp.AAC.1